MATQQLQQAYRFFKANAGWVTPPGRAACALALARAEQTAKDIGLTFVWEHDDCPDDSWMTPAERAQPHECLWCRAMLNGVCYASLCNIFDPDCAYGRVVEAELASEALHQINQQSETAYA